MRVQNLLILFLLVFSFLGNQGFHQEIDSSHDNLITTRASNSSGATLLSKKSGSKIVKTGSYWGAFGLATLVEFYFFKISDKEVFISKYSYKKTIYRRFSGLSPPLELS